jgi:enoyl-CoA hydratase/carnithine racemase
MKRANQITEMSLLVMAMAKAVLKSAAPLDLRAALDAADDLFALCFSSEDQEEGGRLH